MIDTVDVLKQNRELWELFVKSEEYDASLLDRYQRFPYYLSRYRNVMEPEVSAFLKKSGFKLKFPDNRSFAICLTHDIDTLHFPLVSTAGEVANTLVSGRIIQAVTNAAIETGKFVFSAFNKNLNPSRNVEKMIRMEKQYGAVSSFYFLNRDSTVSRFEGYRFDSIKDVLNAVTEAGCEIGLHGGMNAYLDIEKIKKDKTALEGAGGREVTGYRNHYLRFKIPVTWELLEQAGFSYDSTFGYADCAGFRNGMCYPFKPYNLNSEDEMSLWEFPLNIMDTSLFSYMGLDNETAWQVTKNLIDTVAEYKGVLTILWHNTSMKGAGGEFYERILQYGTKKNAWMTSAVNILESVCGNDTEG